MDSRTVCSGDRISCAVSLINRNAAAVGEGSFTFDDDATRRPRVDSVDGVERDFTARSPWAVLALSHDYEKT